MQSSIQDSIRMGTRVYIGRLPYQVRERDIERFFKSYGRIREILLKNGYGFVEFDDYRDADDAVYELNGKELCGERVIIEHARGPSRRGEDDRGRGGGGRGGGYGGGGRDNYRDNRRSSWGDKGGSRGGGGGGRGGGQYGPPTRTEYRLVVENLSSRVSWQDLKDYMRQAGEVTYADAHRDVRGEGVVDFMTRRDMENAKEKLDGKEINGRKIRLIEERGSGGRRSHSRSRSPRRSRSGSDSRSRSRSRSRSGSRSPRRSRSRSSQRSRSASKSRSRSRSGSENR